MTLNYSDLSVVHNESNYMKYSSCNTLSCKKKCALFNSINLMMYLKYLFQISYTIFKFNSKSIDRCFLPWFDKICYRLALRYFACFARAVFRKYKWNRKHVFVPSLCIHKHKITLEFISVLNKHSEITLYLESVHLNDACS